MQSTQPGVLWGEASGARYVDDQAYLVFVLAEIHRLAGDRLHRQVVKRTHVLASLGVIWRLHYVAIGLA